MFVASSFNHFGNCFSVSGCLQGDVKVEVCERLKISGVMMKITNLRSLSLCLKRALCVFCSSSGFYHQWFMT